MMGQKEDQKALIEALQRFTDKADAVLSMNSGNTTSQVSINAGGVGVWVCSTACLVMLAVAMVGGMWMSREFNRVDREMTDRREAMDRMQTYISAIYAQAPHLKPKEEEDAE